MGWGARPWAGAAVDGIVAGGRAGAACRPAALPGPGRSGACLDKILEFNRAKVVWSGNGPILFPQGGPLLPAIRLTDWEQVLLRTARANAPLYHERSLFSQRGPLWQGKERYP